MVLSLLLALLQGSPAVAQPTSDGTVGVLVRLEPGDRDITGTPTVTLRPDDGSAPLTVTLADDGQAPDVSASDGRFAGVVVTNHRAFAVSLTTGDQTLNGGTVAWNSDAGARDLILQWRNGTLSAQASSPDTSTSAPSSAPPQAAVVPPDAGSPTAQASAAQSPPLGPDGIPAPAAVSRPESNDGGFWLVFGGAVLSLVGGALLLRTGNRGRTRGHRLARAPAPPVLGPGTPSMSHGLSIWTIASADRARFLQGILGTIAEHHRVLLVLPPDAPVPMVRGGPVYITRDAQRRAIEAHLTELEAEPGPLPTVVIVEPEPSADRITELRELMAIEPGALLLSTTVPAVHKVSIRAELTETGATLHTAAGAVPLEEQDYCYRRVDT